MKKIFLVPCVLLLLCVSCSSETASENKGEASTALSAEPVDSVGLQLIASDLVSPVFLTQPPNDERLFIVDQIGVIRVVKEGSLLPEPFMDLRSKVVALKHEHEERGLLGLAFHPDFRENGRFFVYYSAPIQPSAPNDFDHTSVIAEYRATGAGLESGDAASGKVILQVDQPQYNHNAGTLMFGPDGYLYISIGDGGNKNDIGTGHVRDWYEENDGGNGQDIKHNLLGSILRIDVNGSSPYAVPADNPFATGNNGMKEIYAYGLRNPFRFSFDRETGMLIAADAGQVLREEIDVITRGGNYGWNVKEGTLCFNAADNKTPLPDCPDADSLGHSFIDPVIEFKNSMTYPEEGLGIVGIGGYVYRGQRQAQLNGSYLFGVWTQHHGKPDGAIFAASVAGEQGPWAYRKLHFRDRASGLGHYLLSFGQDNSGEVYLLVNDEHGPHGNTGKVYRIN
ncbi:glucose/arabinose dehydrogenase [Pontibacter aydingkolensis]|uniref:PQQ-dependent sugar dehydrogenase n=1 Tax=Pontibacter aydingkolensis TaxID=1911536 RepID=A0ABS7CVP4_9BACT|nr:PQQ-dependent sugar dehydrogenase [Pontibacter aydingkolensis]MBW7467776.1 PQQ-dependent sugar dehydrogenase [Pontibacter aydingkolensis]